ncbi:MFS transporter [Escherichia coli]|nr:MFS transporter [Escherichia coli]
MKLTINEKIGFGAGDMAIAIVMMSLAMIITYFYTDVFGLKPVDLGILLFSVRILDTVIDPVVGTMTDRTNTRWGKYRPWLLFMSIPFGISIWLMFTTPNTDYSVKLLWAWATYVLLTLTYTLIAIPYVSLISVITDDPQERLSANGYRFVMTKIAMFAVTIIVPLSAMYLGKNNVQLGYQIAMGAMGILATCLCLYCFFSVRERIYHPKPSLGMAAQFRLLIKNDQWLILGAVIAIIMFGGIIRNSVAAYYAKYYLNGGDALISPFLTSGVIASVLAMIACTWLTRLYDKIKIFRYTQLLAFVVGGAMYFVQPNSIVLAFTFYIVVTFLTDIQLPIYWASIAESVDYGEMKTGQRVSGLAFGGILFFQKFGMGLAGGFIGIALAFMDYQPGVEQTPQALWGICLLMTIIPAILNLITGLIMRFYLINNEYYEQIKVCLQPKNI